MKVSKRCYALQSLYFIPPWGVNAGFIAGSEKTLIVDTGCNYDSANTIYGYASAVKPDNQIVVINTEKHLDHIGGNSFFAEKNIKIYGHRLIDRNESDLEYMIQYFNNCIEDIDRKKHQEARILFNKTKIKNPDIPLDADIKIDLGFSSVRVLLTPGHTDTNISVYVPDENVLFSGDCIINKFIPNLEEGSVYDWKLWLESLNKIRNLDIEKIIPGHGQVIENRAEIDREISRIELFLLQAFENAKGSSVKR